MIEKFIPISIKFNIFIPQLLFKLILEIIIYKCYIDIIKYSYATYLLKSGETELERQTGENIGLYPVLWIRKQFLSCLVLYCSVN